MFWMFIDAVAKIFWSGQGFQETASTSKNNYDIHDILFVTFC